jgi:hypothetical protein
MLQKIELNDDELALILRLRSESEKQKEIDLDDIKPGMTKEARRRAYQKVAEIAKGVGIR